MANKPTAESRDMIALDKNCCRSSLFFAFFALFAVILLCGGCAARVIYVPYGEPIRLRETIKQAKVWVVDDQGKPVAGTLDLPEGWYCLPIPEEPK